MRFLRAVAVAAAVSAIMVAVLGTTWAGTGAGVFLAFALLGAMLAVIGAAVGGLAFVCLKSAIRRNPGLRVLSALISLAVAGVGAWLMSGGAGLRLGDATADTSSLVAAAFALPIICMMAGVPSIVAAVFGFGVGQRPSFGHEMDAFGDDWDDDGEY